MTTVADEKIAKLTRFLHGVSERALKGSLDVDEFILVNQHLLGRGVRADNLIKYARANCPEISPKERIASSAKRGTKAALKTVNPSDILVSSPAGDCLDALKVDLGLLKSLDLSSSENDNQELQSLFVLPHRMYDAEIVENLCGSKGLLHTKKATVFQLIREVDLARSGERGLFKKSRRGYLLYLRGNSGSLAQVYVHWDPRNTAWLVDCFHFGPGGRWPADTEVCGN